jgi:elongator complex protein 2
LNCVLTATMVTSYQRFSITFDALLVGHEGSVTSLSWRPYTSRFTTTLLSTSTDSSIILWSPSNALLPSQDGTASIWINRWRFGDVGGQKVGGFVGGMWAGHGREALAWGWAGGWRRWISTEALEIPDEEGWKEIGAVGGHNGPVQGIDWSPNGEYLISVGYV